MNPLGAVWGWIKDGTSYFLGAVSGMLSHWFGKILSFCGLTMVSFDVLLPQLKTFVLQYVSALPPDAINFLGAIGIGKAMSMVFSALVVVFGGRVTLMRKTHADALGIGGNP